MYSVRPIPPSPELRRNDPAPQNDASHVRPGITIVEQARTEYKTQMSESVVSDGLLRADLQPRPALVAGRLVMCLLHGTRDDRGFPGRSRPAIISLTRHPGHQPGAWATGGLRPATMSPARHPVTRRHPRPGPG